MDEFVSAPVLLNPIAGLGRPHRVRRFLTVSTAVMISLASLWAVVALLIPHYALFAGDLVLIVIGLGVLALIRRRWITAAIHTLLIGLLAWIPAVAYFVSGSGVDHDGAVHYWLIVLIVGLHFVLFDAARLIQTLYVSVAILLFVCIEYDLIPLEPRFGFPQHERLFTHGLTVGLVLIALAWVMRSYITSLAEAERRAREATQRSEQLILNVLPQSVVARLRGDGKTFAQRFQSCSILFADLVGFTPLAARMSPEEVVALLNRVFVRFDALTRKYGVEKIKTIGDGYMAAAGLPDEQVDHAARLARLALEMLAVIEEFDELSMRIGINSGQVVAGIIGQHRFSYDLWGETVNLASRMESHSANGRIQVSETTFKLLREDFEFEDRGLVDVKGRGPTSAYFLIGEKPA